MSPSVEGGSELRMKPTLVIFGRETSLSPMSQTLERSQIPHNGLQECAGPVDSESWLSLILYRSAKRLMPPKAISIQER
ncbi:hypothetical protein NPIL_405331 [Nephila pilipes]|uniref:Uncharacterized protein n=1 Tax=Nephila pilipes TaxID=299642 RepID=A0A8X6UID1_NEPPI|nr:hypothetical protein NPIL_405331 [Nephila pilipes]